MKKSVFFSCLILCFLILFGCGQKENKQKVLVEGVIITDMNIRSTPELNGDENLLYEESVPGTIVEILEFNPTPTKEGYFWCKVKTKRTIIMNDVAYNEGWMVYKNNQLPYVVSTNAWALIEKTLGMEYQDTPHYLAKKNNKPFFLQGVFDLNYRPNLVDIKTEYEKLQNESGEVTKGSYLYDINQTPRYSIKYADDDKYSKYCRARISTASKNGKDENGNRIDAEALVIFEQNPQKIHIFHQNMKTKRGEHVFSYDLASLNDDIKSISRISRRKKVYQKGYDYYGNYKSLIKLNFDAIRIRTLSNKYYILYNSGLTTSYSLNNLRLDYVEEFRD